MEKEKKSISVIIPCYNSENFIIEALKSLENQIFKDFEVICINDGSEDRTLELINSYISQSSLLIRCINQINGGVSRARNKGICEAKCDYITFLDADDVYHPYFLEELFKHMSDNIDFTYCKLTRNFENYTSFRTSENIVTYQVDEDRDQFMKKALYKMGMYGFSCYMYKKSIIDRADLKFPEDIKYGEDRSFVWKYLVHCNKAKYVDYCLYIYRDNHNSAVNITNWNRTDSLKAVNQTIKYLQQNKCEFYSEYSQYMYSRDVWAVAKNFSCGRRKDLFLKFIQEYDVKSAMKQLFKDNSKLVMVSSLIYCINPMFFYRTINLFYLLRSIKK